MLSVLKRLSRPLPKRFSRPLTPQMRSYVERKHGRVKKRNQEKWKRAARRVKSAIGDQWVIWRKWLLIGGVCLTVIAFVVLLFSPLLSVREIRVIRTEGRVDVRAVLQALTPQYGQRMMFLSQQEIAAAVRQVVPDVADIIVQKEYPSRISVRITLKPLAARLQVENPGQVAGSGATVPVAGSGAVVGPKTYDFLTANGTYVVSDTQQLQLPLPIIRVVDWGVHPVPNSPLISEEILQNMKQAEEALTLEFGQEVRLRTVYIRAREFHLETSKKISFWFDIRTPLQQQLGRLRSFLKSAKLTDVKSYIDLRLVGRVVYK
jgi:hypothetical protein